MIKQNKKIVYHRSKTPVKKWDEYEKNISGFYSGLYASFDENEFQNYGPYIYAFDITNANLIPETKIDSIKNDLINISNKYRFIVSQASGVWISKSLKMLNYDGIQRGNSEVVLFDPEKFLLNKKKSNIIINESLLYKSFLNEKYIDYYSLASSAAKLFFDKIENISKSKDMLIGVKGVTINTSENEITFAINEENKYNFLDINISSKYNIPYFIFIKLPDKEGEKILGSYVYNENIDAHYIYLYVKENVFYDFLYLEDINNIRRELEPILSHEFTHFFDKLINYNDFRERSLTKPKQNKTDNHNYYYSYNEILARISDLLFEYEYRIKNRIKYYKSINKDSEEIKQIILSSELQQKRFINFIYLKMKKLLLINNVIPSLNFKKKIANIAAKEFEKFKEKILTDYFSSSS